MRRRVSVLALTLALVSGLGEGAHRLWLLSAGRPYAIAAVARRIEAEVDLTSVFTPPKASDTRARSDHPERLSEQRNRDKSSNTLHPYTGSEREHDTGEVLEAFREGFPEGTYVIVIVGGSVAAGFGDMGSSTEQEHPLVQGLRGDPRFQGKRVQVLNYAHVAYKQPQQVMRLAYLLSLGFVPDAVINIDGYNETVAASFNAMKGIHPAYPSPVIWGLWLTSREDRDTILQRGRLIELSDAKRELGRLCFDWGLHRSSLLGSFVMNRLRNMNLEGAKIQNELSSPQDSNVIELRQTQGPDFDPEPRAALEACTRVGFESSRSLSALCQSRGIHYLHVLQPALNDAGSKELAADELEIQKRVGEQEAARTAFPVMRALGKELSQLGIAFVDASGVFSMTRAALFIDPVHFNDRGKQIFAKAVVEGFRRSLDP